MSMQKKSGIDIQLNKDWSNIPYLMFVDNYIIFCKPTKTAAPNVGNTLDHYCNVLGQFINLHKSKIHFSTKINNAYKRDIE